MPFTKETLTYLWSKTPWYLKWVLGIIVIPNLIVNAIIVLLYVLPWYANDLGSAIHDSEARRDVQITHILEMQAQQNKSTLEYLGKLDIQQNIMYSEMLRRR